MGPRAVVLCVAAAAQGILASERVLPDTTGTTVTTDTVPPPAVLGLNATALVLVRQLISEGKLPPRLQPALSALRQSADSAMLLRGWQGWLNRSGHEYGCPETGPWSVTSKTIMPPSGDKHDFAYIDTYAWPCNARCNVTDFSPEHCKDWRGRLSWLEKSAARFPDWTRCDNATGMPWVIHDGFAQPLGQHDTDCSVLMSDTVETLSQAYFLTQNESYAQTAAAVLRAWFIAPRTAMKPHLQYAAYLPGGFNGSAAGEIATTFRWSSKVTDSAALLVGSMHWSADDAAVMNRWNAAYLEWFLRRTDSVFQAPNNIFSWLLVESMSLALSTLNGSVARQLVSRATDSIVPGCLQNQIGETGVMEHEASREAGATYSVMNMQALFSMASVGSHAGADLWDFRVVDGRTPHHDFGGNDHEPPRSLIRKALDYLLVYATNSSAQWPWKQEGSNTPWASFPWGDLAPLMRRAAIVYDDDIYENMIAKLPPRRLPPWREGGRALPWETDIAQLLWPRL
eukprot:COSAG06_NODE_169_length_21469_cov_23.096865_7_plen_512_part_00